MVQAHVFITGQVQGVGFRQFVKSEARKYSICGWVQNLPDGRVEAMLQGKKDAIEQILMVCQKGPFLAEVENVEVAWEKDLEAVDNFEIIQ
ncbi:MAG: acylphosphatase [Candidatus Levybacteria bacterium]|nr:acylphosphatase [Candidatus Levybacteria bacterium]